mmetsp:Transcript_30031/g.29279  ORF Transcript_30031/g.29279 Transcript_30031/m.29279 type:complete len:90 (-) Transcript_30031:1577-1846(-)
MLLITCLIVNTKKKPFVSLALNELETYSLASSMITIYCGIFFISDTRETIDVNDNETHLTLSERAKLFFFIIIVIVNIIFFLIWSVRMY